jgi:enoyl-CoA hydratase
VSPEAGAAARLEREEGGLAVLTLDSPPLNLFDRRMIDDFQAAVADLAAEPPRALLIRAEGRAVSGGVDVHVFEGLTPEQGCRLWDELLDTIDQLEALPAPIVFAAHALTLTAAFEVALACDLIVASREAVFGLPEVRRGLLAAGGGLVRLPRLLPPRVAAEIILTGEFVGAERMAEHGVVSRLTDPGSAVDAALELAAKIAANAPLAVAGARRMLQLAPDLDEAALWEEMRKLNAEVGSSEDALEGARAFAEKRPPEWKGR